VWYFILLSASVHAVHVAGAVQIFVDWSLIHWLVDWKCGALYITHPEGMQTTVDQVTAQVNRSSGNITSPNLNLNNLPNILKPCRYWYHCKKYAKRKTLPSTETSQRVAVTTDVSDDVITVYDAVAWRHLILSIKAKVHSPDFTPHDKFSFELTEFGPWRSAVQCNYFDLYAYCVSMMRRHQPITEQHWIPLAWLLLFLSS